MKSHWNYRILAVETDGEVWLQMHEVYYKNGVPDSYTEEPAVISGEARSDIDWCIEKAVEATKKPILWHGDRFPEIYKP